MNFEKRIIDTILNCIKDNQVYLTQKENLPQLAKLGYMYNTLWYGGRCASYDGVIEKKVYTEDDGETWENEQCDDNPKYKIEMCEPENEKIEDYIYDAWGMHVENGYGPGWEEFIKIMTIGRPLTDLEVKTLKPNKTFDEWVEIFTDSTYRYASHYSDRRAVANYLLCVIGTGYGFRNGCIIEEASGADQDSTDYGDWMNAEFREDIKEIVEGILTDPEVEKVLKHIDVKSAEFKAKELQKEIDSFGMSYKDFLKSDRYKNMFKKEKENFEYYPISEYSIITKLNKKSDPSYIKAGIEICEDIVANPPKYKKDYNQYQKDECDKQVAFAKKFLNKFKT